MSTAKRFRTFPASRSLTAHYADAADAFVGHSVKGVADVYDHSQLQKQWYVVQRRHGCLSVKTEIAHPIPLRIFTGD
jgi:hypothetical protein